MMGLNNGIPLLSSVYDTESRPLLFQTFNP
jgi:hypothetical protein